MFRVGKRNVSLRRFLEKFLLPTRNLRLIEKIYDNTDFGGLHIFMSTSLLYEVLIFRNKTSSPEVFECMRFFLFDLILYLPSTMFQLNRDGDLPG